MADSLPIRLVSYQSPAGAPTSIGLIIGDERIIDLPAAGRDLGVELGPDMVAYIQREDYVDFARRVLDTVERGDGRAAAWTKQRADSKLLAPVPRPNSIRDVPVFLEHVKDGMAAIGQPVSPWIGRIPGYYKGNPSTVIGIDDEVWIPSYADTVDFEMEVGIYIRKKGVNIKAADAEQYIGGFTIFNDASARSRQGDEQNIGLGPAKGKDFDNGNVMGPAIVPHLDLDSAVYDVRVNGESWVDGSLKGMHWTWGELLEYISESETLYPGDFIAAGTVPHGCGLELGRYPQPGDTVELEVQPIGVMHLTWGRSK